MRICEHVCIYVPCMKTYTNVHFSFEHISIEYKHTHSYSNIHTHTHIFTITHMDIHIYVNRCIHINTGIFIYNFTFIR